MLRFSLTALFACLASVAAAEWRYEPAFGPAGRALGFGSGGQTIAMDCGPGGLPAFTVFGPRPVGGAQADYILQVDQGEEWFYPAECGADGCLILFEDSPDIRRLLAGLRGGTALSLSFFRNGFGGTIPLAGSAAALDQVFSAGCDTP